MQDISFILLGFFTGLSLILAIGAQNIFVIEQGLKKQYVFLVCLICSISDLLLIFLGIFLFEYFRNLITNTVELFFNILLLVFLVYFIIGKVRFNYDNLSIYLKKIQYCQNFYLQYLILIRIIGWMHHLEKKIMLV